MDQTAEHIPPFDRRHSGSHGGNLRWSVTCRHGQAQSPMRPLLDVVHEIGLEHAFEVPAPVDQDVVEALAAHGPHEALGNGIRPRRPDRGSDDPDALDPEHRIERSRELRVPVAHQEPDT